jgi:hypothetical protein
MSSLTFLHLDDIINIDSLPLINELECQIDNVIPLNPIMCVHCQTIFCENCINKWKSDGHNICPKRCSPLTTRGVEGTILEQQLQSIRLKCKNYNNGCKQHLMLNEKNNHESICEYNSKQCSYCNEMIVIKEEFMHLLNQCEMFKVICLFCRGKFSFNEINKHVDICKETFDCNRKLFQIEKCVQCGTFDYKDSINEIKDHKCVKFNNKIEEMLYYYRFIEQNELQVNAVFLNENKDMNIFIKDIEAKTNKLLTLKTNNLNALNTQIENIKQKLTTKRNESIQQLKREITNEQKEINDIKHSLNNMQTYQTQFNDMKTAITNAKSFEHLEKLLSYEQLKLQFKHDIILNNSNNNN